MTPRRTPTAAPSLRAWIVGGAAVLVLVTVTSLVGLLVLATRMRTALEHEASTLLSEQQIVDRLDRDISRQLIDAVSFVGDPRPATLDSFRRRGQSVYVAVRRYLFRDLSLAQRLQVERVKELHQTLEVRAQEAFDARLAGARPSGELSPMLLAAADSLQDALDRFLALRSADYDAALARHAATLRRLYTAAGLLAAALLAAMALATRLVRRRLLLPLDELSRAADRIGAGDLDTRVAVRHHDELGRVGGRFNAMADGIAALQRELQRSEDRYRRLVELSPDAVIVHGDDRILLVNAAATQQLGAAHASQLVGRPLVDLVHPEAPRDEADRLSRMLARAEPPSALELPFRRLDGAQVHGELAAAPFEYEGRRAMLLVLRDVTTRRAAETALQAAAEQLQQAQKMEAVGRLAGGIAHDFNNLLTVITSCSELLAADMPPGDARREDVSEIRAAARRASVLTGQLLAFSRKQVLHPRMTDLNEVVRDIGTLLRRLVREDIELHTDLAPAVPRVEVDPGRLEQVILNLVLNARDAMPHGGRLTIRTDLAVLGAGAAPHPTDVPPGSYVVLSVRDTGLGMDRATQERVFEPFFTTKEVGKGTGLGLATVYGIVKQSGGHVRVWSEPGEGSLFELFLPSGEAEAHAPASADAAPEAPAGRGETVLLVEDDDAVRTLARRVLERTGYVVVEARDGEEALRLSAAHGRDVRLLLTDVVMPRLGGRELAQRLTAASPGLAVLYVSGYTEDEVLRRGLLSPHERFLSKPYAPHELVAQVREALDASSAR